MKKEKRIKKDEKVLRAFIKTYCRENHLKKGAAEVNGGYCGECHKLLQYALKRNEKCPLDPKPKCKDCEIHCYVAENRQKIRDVMRFSGQYYIKRGRIDWLFHYFF